MATKMKNKFVRETKAASSRKLKNKAAPMKAKSRKTKDEEPKRKKRRVIVEDVPVKKKRDKDKKKKRDKTTTGGGKSAIPLKRGRRTKDPEAVKLREARRAEKKLKKLAGKFGVTNGEIQELIHDGNIDQAVAKFQRKMLAAITQMIPLAEKQYRKNPTQSNAYALSSMISNAREIGQDLQATGDREKLAETLVMEILVPNFKAIAQSVVDEMFALQRKLRVMLKRDDRAAGLRELDQAGHRIAVSAQEAFKITRDGVRERLTT